MNGWVSFDAEKVCKKLDEFSEAKVAEMKEVVKYEE